MLVRGRGFVLELNAVPAANMVILSPIIYVPLVGNGQRTQRVERISACALDVNRVTWPYIVGNPYLGDMRTLRHADILGGDQTKSRSAQLRAALISSQLSECMCTCTC